jgi:hypothetical protein
MFVRSRRPGTSICPVVDAHEGEGVLDDRFAERRRQPGRRDHVPGFTMADLVQSMNAASQRGDCVAVLQSYRPKATP